MVILDYLKQTELSVDERDFTSNIPRPSSIFPENKQLGIVLSGTQQMGERWSAQADVQYAKVKRRTESVSNSPVGVAQVPVDMDRSNAGLTLTYRAFGDWEVSLDGLISKEDTDFDRLVVATGSTVLDPSSAFHDLVEKQWNVGLKASGTMLELPAGRVGLALGTTHRSEDFLHRSTDLVNDEVAGREVNSAFAEIHLPLFGNANSRRGLQRLELSIAGRYDDYSDFGDTVNPKVGISWEPFNGLELRSSYSTSFRAPAAGRELATSFSGLNPFVLIVSFATPDGGATLPVAFIQGASRLQPEEAENWTAGLTLRPEAVAGLQVGLTYYDIAYTDRIVLPPFDQGALSNPGLQSFLTSYSSPAELQAALAALGATTYLDITGPLFSGGEFGPNPENLTTVLYDSRFTNAGRVNTSGVDLNVDYRTDWMGGIADLGLNVNRITKIDTSFAPGAPTVHLVDTIGNPARSRFRTTAAFARGSWDAALAVNYTDKYTDTSGVANAGVSAYVTVDGNLRYTVQNPASDAFDNVSLALSVVNLFNESPPFVQASGTSGAHYDPANADPLGRLIAIEVSKRW